MRLLFPDDSGIAPVPSLFIIASLCGLGACVCVFRVGVCGLGDLCFSLVRMACQEAAGIDI